MYKIKIEAYIHLLTLSIKNNITLAESANILEKVYNKNIYKGSNVNANNIYQKENNDKITYDFFKNVKLIKISNEYYFLLNEIDYTLYENIKFVGSLNKKIFLNSNSYFKKNKKELLNNFEKINRDEVCLSLLTKNYNKASIVIEFENEYYVITYEKFNYGDIFNRDFNLMINDKLSKINALIVFEYVDSNFKNNFIEITNNFINEYKIKHKLSLFNV